MPSPPAPGATPEPQAGHRDPALDGLRGLAALLVYLYHYGGGLRSTHAAVRLLGYGVQMGWVGVELFFALSGYLITGLFWADRDAPHAFRNFYARRALRILPLYYLALLLAAGTASVAGATPAQLRPLLVYPLFLQNLPPLVNTALHYPTPLLLNHLWSLAVEEQFYLLWPLLLLLASTRRRAFNLCLWTFAASCAFRLLIFWPGLLPPAMALTWSPFLLTRAGAIALGGALALAPASPAAFRRLAVAGLAIAGGTFLVYGATQGSFLLQTGAAYMVALPAVHLACAALLTLALSPGPLRQGLGWAPLRWLGSISYGFYVFHILIEPVFDAIGQAATHSTGGFAYQFVRLVVAFPLTAAIAWLSFRFFETPFLRLKYRFPHPAASSAIPDTAANLHPSP